MKIVKKKKPLCSPDSCQQVGIFAAGQTGRCGSYIYEIQLFGLRCDLLLTIMYAFLFNFLKIFKS